MKHIKTFESFNSVYPVNEGITSWLKGIISKYSGKKDDDEFIIELINKVVDLEWNQISQLNIECYDNTVHIKPSAVFKPSKYLYKELSKLLRDKRQEHLSSNTPDKIDMEKKFAINKVRNYRKPSMSAYPAAEPRGTLHRSGIF